jgi:hypothetical protein
MNGKWYGGYAKDWKHGGKGKGDGAKGVQLKGCPGCGEAGNWLKDCTKLQAKVKQVEEEGT